MPLRALVCCCVLAALFALGGAPVASAQGSVLRVGLSQLPATLDPALAVDGSAAIVARHVFDRLFPPPAGAGGGGAGGGRPRGGGRGGGGRGTGPPGPSGCGRAFASTTAPPSRLSTWR